MRRGEAERDPPTHEASWGPVGGPRAASAQAVGKSAVPTGWRADARRRAGGARCEMTTSADGPRSAPVTRPGSAVPAVDSRR